MRERGSRHESLCFNQRDALHLRGNQIGCIYRGCKVHLAADYGALTEQQVALFSVDRRFVATPFTAEPERIGTQFNHIRFFR
jgi:hypothetical protein